MNFLDIFSKKKKVTQGSNMLSDQHIDDLIFSLSHHKTHTLSVALIQASRIINFIDPENVLINTFSREEGLLAQDEREIIRLTKEIINNAEEAYQDNRENIDVFFNNSVH